MAKILCADSDKRLSWLPNDFWDTTGHEWAAVPCGASVCDFLRDHGGDLAIVEVMLPDVCGFEVCRRIRADRQLFTTPVMLVSQTADTEEIEHGLAQGADDYLDKSLDSLELQRRIRSVLDASAAAAMPDPVTNLMNERMAKYMVQHCVSARNPFALVCFEVIRLAEFARQAGTGAAGIALRRAACILETCGRPLKDDFFRPAHMGAAHFMCLVPPKMAEKYCNWVYSTWVKRLPELYEFLGVVPADPDKPGTQGVPCLDALLYYTVCPGHTRSSAHDCFQTLITIREHALRSGGGIFADHRVH